MMKKLSMALGLVIVLGLQGCGGGSADDSNIEKTDIKKSAIEDSSTQSKSKTDEENIATKAVDDVVYVLKEKLQVFPEYNATTTYTYNGNYVAESNTTTTFGYEIDKTYDYNQTSKVLKVMVNDLLDQKVLTQRVKFEDGDMAKHIDLSRNVHQIYLYTTFDPITYYEHKRAVENVKDIEKELYNTEYFTYTDNNLSNLKRGYKDSLDGDFTLVDEFEYTYDDEVGNLTLDHTFEYSDDNKTVTEKDGDNIVRVYKFEVVGE